MLNYQIALTNAIFDDTYRNVLRFDTREEQEAYFNVNTLFANNPELKCNFHVGALYATSVVVDVDTDDLNEALNYNYCIVKDTTPGATLKYYYYFVKKAQQDNANRLVCDLELDVYQTYYIDLTFGDCTIVRAHLNRFVDNGDNTVSFDANPNSKLFEREEIQDVPKRLINRQRVNTGNAFVDENIICWMYIYLDPHHTFNFYTPDHSSRTINGYRIKQALIPTNLSCLVVPIVKKPINLTINMSGGNTYTTTIGSTNTMGADFLRGFETLNNDYSFVYSIKLSLVPPSVTFNEITENMTLNATNLSGNIFPPTSYGLRNFGIGEIVAVKDLDTYLSGIMLSSTYNTSGYMDKVTLGNVTLTKNLKFAKSEIINADTNSKFNPKLNNNDYYELNICDTAGNSFTYDLQKFNDTNLEVLMTEPLTPDFTKNYTRLNPPLNNTLYIEDTTKNLLGLVTSNDNSIVMPTSSYQAMIANNKNFYAQNSFNRNVSLFNNLGIAAQKGNMVEFGLNVLGSGVEYAKSVVNQEYEIDNLRNAPSSIEAANGNFIFSALCSRAGIYIEEYDITENSRKAINDFMMLYGFNYNRIDNIKNVDNIRKNYNYVKAYVEEINTGLVNISNVVHNKIREIFANGIRMWNLREFTYEKENYERWLEE